MNRVSNMLFSNDPIEFMQDGILLPVYGCTELNKQDQ
jgi:hypothetical protein